MGARGSVGEVAEGVRGVRVARAAAAAEVSGESAWVVHGVACAARTPACTGLLAVLEAGGHDLDGCPTSGSRAHERTSGRAWERRCGVGAGAWGQAEAARSERRAGGRRVARPRVCVRLRGGRVWESAEARAAAAAGEVVMRARGGARGGAGWARVGAWGRWRRG